MLFAFFPEDCFTSSNRFINARWAAHFAGSVENGENLRIGRWMATYPSARRNAKNGRLEGRTLRNGTSQRRDRHAVQQLFAGHEADVLTKPEPFQETSFVSRLQTAERLRGI